MKVFWSWQYDTDGHTGRFFVRDALKEAIKKLKQPPGLEEPNERDLRDGIHLDHDRKDVSGTPSIADVIFKKIDATNVFVADVTPVATLTRLRPSEGEEPEKKMINANVAIEYGYAVRTVTDELILLVQNLHYGNRGDLPFDLQHKGSPIQYRLAPDAPKAEQNAVKGKLVGDLFVALRSCLVTLAKSAPPGSGRRYRRPASATQFPTPKNRRMTYVAKVFTHRVVYLTTDAVPQVDRIARVTGMARMMVTRLTKRSRRTAITSTW
jgi:hypothetical protein